MFPMIDRFRPIFEAYDITLIIPEGQYERLEEQELLQFAGNVDGVICGDDRYTENVIQKSVPRLRVISKWGTGLDAIDRQAATLYGVKVCNTANAFTLPVSENVLGWLLCFARQLPWMDQMVKQGFWGKLPGRSLTESTLGVVGVGNIGKAVIRRARAFGMTIVATDIVPLAPDFIFENAVRMVPFDELLRVSDFVSLNCDLNPTSRHLMNEAAFSKMKPTAVLINTSRGPVVDEAALVKALESKTIAGAALDVFEEEPIPKSSSLLKMDNVMVAPHNGSSSPAAWDRVHHNTIRNLLLGLGIQDLSIFEKMMTDSAAK